MKKHAFQIAALLLAIPLLVGLSGCAVSTGANSGAAPRTALAEAVVSTVQLSDEDTQTAWDDAAATHIALADGSTTIDGAGAAIDGNTLTISKAGTYVVSGALNGQILISADKNDTVRLVLSGVSVASPDSAALYAAKCAKLVVTLAEGTENSLTDGGAAYTYAKEADEEPNAALFSKNDLTINGEGRLTVSAGFNNGIGTKDNLVIAGGTITVNAANHGLRGSDGVTIAGGSLNITAGNDGVQTSNTGDTGIGDIQIAGGTFVINAAHDGIQAEANLTITGGTFTVTSGGGVAKAQAASATQTESDSYKGIKAAGDLAVTGGTFLIDSYDDCVHSNANVSLTGGAFTLSTGDDGVHADNDLTVNADITILTCYEGLEGTNVTIQGGKISIRSTDDGINASGAGGSGPGGRFGMDKFTGAASASGSYCLNIDGGDITIVAGTDALDSNGDINVTGGQVVALSSNGYGGDGGIDPDGTFTITGGTVIYGGTNAGTNPGGSSTQSYVYLAQSVKAGTEVTLVQGGQTIATFTPEIDCSVIAITAPGVTGGQSYDVYTGGTLLASATAGTGGGMNMGGGGGRGGNMGGGGRGSGGGGRP